MKVLLWTWVATEDSYYCEIGKRRANIEEDEMVTSTWFAYIYNIKLTFDKNAATDIIKYFVVYAPSIKIIEFGRSLV